MKTETKKTTTTLFHLPQNNEQIPASSSLSIITWNINGLSAAIKRHRVAKCIKKHNTCIYAAYKRLTLDLKTHTDWNGGDAKSFLWKWKWNESCVPEIVSDKKDFLKQHYSKR